MFNIVLAFLVFFSVVHLSFATENYNKDELIEAHLKTLGAIYEPKGIHTELQTSPLNISQEWKEIGSVEWECRVVPLRKKFVLKLDEIKDFFHKSPTNPELEISLFEGNIYQIYFVLNQIFREDKQEIHRQLLYKIKLLHTPVAP